MKTLAKHVFIAHPEDPSKSQWFAPGDILPDWAAKIATAPGLFGESEPAVQTNDDALFEEIDYSGMKVEELKMLLTERNLETDGNKAALIKRLEAHDAAIG